MNREIHLRRWILVSGAVVASAALLGTILLLPIKKAFFKKIRQAFFSSLCNLAHSVFPDVVASLSRGSPSAVRRAACGLSVFHKTRPRLQVSAQERRQESK
jgi:hypothetical protein